MSCHSFPHDDWKRPEFVAVFPREDGSQFRVGWDTYKGNPYLVLSSWELVDMPPTRSKHAPKTLWYPVEGSVTRLGLQEVVRLTDALADCGLEAQEKLTLARRKGR